MTIAEIYENAKRKLDKNEITIGEFAEIVDVEVDTYKPSIGHWINLENTKYKWQVLPFWCRYECSKCGGHGDGTSNYCPNCGAKMEVTESADSN